MRPHQLLMTVFLSMIHDTDLILTTRSSTAYDVFRKGLWILRSYKLRVVWQANVYHTIDRL